MGHKVIEARAVIGNEYDEYAEAFARDLSDFITAYQKTRAPFVQWGVEVVEEVE